MKGLRSHPSGRDGTGGEAVGRQSQRAWVEQRDLELAARAKVLEPSVGGDAGSVQMMMALGFGAAFSLFEGDWISVE